MKPPSPSIRFAILILSIALPFFVSVSSTVAASRPDSGVDPYPLHANQIIGNQVENLDGKALGDVTDLVVDLQSGQVAYVVVSAGGFLGVLADLRPVPPEAFSVRGPSSEPTFVLDIAEERWSEAPSVDRSHQTTRLGVEYYASQIYRFYGFEWDLRQREASQFDDPRIQNLERAPESPTDPPEGSPPREDPFLQIGELHLARNLTGTTVETRMRQEIGHLEDLLVQLDRGWIQFALLRPSEVWAERQEHLYAVAPQALVVLNGQILLHVAPEQFEGAPVLTEENFASTSREQARIHPAEAREEPVVFQYVPRAQQDGDQK